MLDNAVYVTYFLFCTAYIMIFLVIKRSLVTYMQPVAIDPPTNAAIGQSSDGRRAATSKKPTT